MELMEWWIGRAAQGTGEIFDRKQEHYQQLVAAFTNRHRILVNNATVRDRRYTSGGRK